MKTCLFHIHILGLTTNLMQVFFDLHGPSLVSSILYMSAFSLSKASTLITVPSYSRHKAGHPYPLDTYI